MIITMILIFVLGYLCIALEHKLRIDKAAIALLMCGALWTVLSLLGNDAQIGTQLIEQLGAQAAAVRRPALQPLRSRSRCRRAAVRAHIQGCNGTAALPGHADIVGCAVGLHGARL